MPSPAHTPNQETTTGPKVLTVPCLKDNYAYLVHLPGNNEAVCIDASDAAPIAHALQENQLRLAAILSTHHHLDHVGGNTELSRHWNCPVYCSTLDLSRIPAATNALQPNETATVAGLNFIALAVPGHTLGATAFHEAAHKLLFTGDTLFLGGCGRVFEGTHAQLYHSLQTLKALPPLTNIYCGHEYTRPNLRFAQEVLGPSDALQMRLQTIQISECTVPGLLAEELLTNPFLIAATEAQFILWRNQKDGR